MAICTAIILCYKRILSDIWQYVQHHYITQEKFTEGSLPFEIVLAIYRCQCLKDVTSDIYPPHLKCSQRCLIFHSSATFHSLTFLKTRILISGFHNFFKKSTSHFQALDARMVTYNKFHTEGAKFWSGL